MQDRPRSAALLFAASLPLLAGCYSAQYGGGPTAFTDQQRSAGREVAERLTARAEKLMAEEQAQAAAAENEAAAREEAAAAAEKAGRLDEAFKAYVDALNSLSPEAAPEQDLRLRERVIKLAQRLPQKPTLPEEAKKRMAFGKAAFKEADSPEGYVKAAAEYGAASNLAPWLPESYFNLALVQEKAGMIAEAVKSFKLYLLASPGDADREKVQNRIYELEYKTGDAHAPQSLAGTWTYTFMVQAADYGMIKRTAGKSTAVYRITTSGDDFTIERPAAPYTSAAVMWTGTLRGRRVTGRYTQGSAVNCGDERHDPYSSGSFRMVQSKAILCSFPEDFSLPMSGELSADGDKLTLHYELATTTVSVNSRSSGSLGGTAQSMTTISMGLTGALKPSTLTLVRAGPGEAGEGESKAGRAGKALGGGLRKKD